MSNDIILCVDDEHIILMAMENDLKRKFGDRFEYAMAHNGNEALATADKLIKEGRKLALVLSDHRMPGMSSDDLLVEFHRRHPDVPTALITGGYLNENKEHLIKNAGLVANVCKPWTSGEICSIVERFALISN